MEDVGWWRGRWRELNVGYSKETTTMFLIKNSAGKSKILGEFVSDTTGQ